MIEKIFDENVILGILLLATEKVAEILVKNGANVNSANYGGWTVLHSAVNRGEFKTFRMSEFLYYTIS